ncbi:MAG TPA: cytochrome c1 [Salinisphaeraceae bacterium]|nr:cytochrome c1 [Salinisphaeraceae bacterium]
MMRRLFVAIILLLPMATIAAAELPYSFTPDLSNEASLQRGAKLYMNYCSGCHTLNHMRYSTIAKDLGIPEDIVQYNLMMTSDEIHSQIRGTMPDKSKEWFGTVPPDLTLTARLHGANWLYNFLLTFYVDETQENGVNNLVMESTAMPWALWPLQGYQKLTTEGDGDSPEFELVQEGSMEPTEFRRAVGDLVNFLEYVGEPMKLERYSLGIKVIIFLLVFTVLAYLLKREMWRDVK